MKKIYIDDEGRIFEGLEAEVVEQVEDNLENAGYFEAVEKETKGGSKMSKLFEKVRINKVVEFKKKDGKIKRKAKMIKAITVESVKDTFKTPETYLASGVVGLQQGLKYKGDFKAGSKAGIATAAVMAGINVAGSIAANIDKIKEV